MLDDLVNGSLHLFLWGQGHRRRKGSGERREESSRGSSGVLDENGAEREIAMSVFDSEQGDSRETHSMMTRAAMASTMGTALRERDKRRLDLGR